MMEIHFLPASPLWLTVFLSFLALIAAGIVVVRLGRSGWLRACLAFVLSLYLANPVLRELQTAPGNSTALLFRDRSGSMAVDSRGTEAGKATLALTKQAKGQKWQVQEISNSGADSTLFEATLSASLSRVSPKDLSAVVLVTDGIVHDSAVLDRLKSIAKPVHIILAGNPDLIDRRLSVISAPPYALVGKQAKITVRMDDLKDAPAAQLSWSVDGVSQKPLVLTPNKNMSLMVPVTRRGRIDVTMSVAERSGEVTSENNAALVQLNGVRDRLQVLLVSGAPYPGGRLWRDTLKSDPSIDLIHFTILRLPSSFDLTPNSELSLIPFPVEQLFQERLNSFDLVIFDSFGALDLLDPGYFTNVSDYVSKGGALFVVAGPEFGRSESLSSTGLSKILPLTPTGMPQELTYVPQKTRDGARHPVTAPLNDRWGPWFQEAQVQAAFGVTLMTGARGQPLMQIAEVGKGRVGMIASNQLWVWARGTQPGPWNEVSRRMAHWLMQEPDLDSERLIATGKDRLLTITRKALRPTDGVAIVTAPDGSRAMVSMRSTQTGSQASLSTRQTGIYRIVQDNLSTAVMIGGNTLEIRDIRPTDARLRGLAEATGGSITWLKDGLPPLRFDPTASRRVTGERNIPLIPAWLALVLSTGLAGLIWFSERK
jgi:hypothetical protein